MSQFTVLILVLKAKLLIFLLEAVILSTALNNTDCYQALWRDRLSGSVCLGFNDFFQQKLGYITPES